jgi:DNA repair ATPase RecN
MKKLIAVLIMVCFMAGPSQAFTDKEADQLNKHVAVTRQLIKATSDLMKDMGHMKEITEEQQKQINALRDAIYALIQELDTQDLRVLDLETRLTVLEHFLYEVLS